MNKCNDHPSPFYAQFDDAVVATLCFPADEDGVGPYWLESGELDASQSCSRSCEKVEVVDLGNGRYRLAFKNGGPFSGLRLNWGDVFVAEGAVGKQLELLRVTSPPDYKHFEFMVSSSFNNESPLAKLAHRFGGGWEAIAGGMLTLTVPTSTASDFVGAAQQANIISVDAFN